MIEVWPIGTLVNLPTEVEMAVITRIQIQQENGILYEVGWWKLGERKEAWFSEREFTVHEMDKQKIGFKT